MTPERAKALAEMRQAHAEMDRLDRIWFASVVIAVVVALAAFTAWMVW